MRRIGCPLPDVLQQGLCEFGRLDGGVGALGLDEGSRAEFIIRVPLGFPRLLLRLVRRPPVLRLVLDALKV
jgi:hypothetical protein